MNSLFKSSQEEYGEILDSWFTYFRAGFGLEKFSRGFWSKWVPVTI